MVFLLYSQTVFKTNTFYTTLACDQLKYSDVRYSATSFSLNLLCHILVGTNLVIGKVTLELGELDTSQLNLNYKKK